LSGERSLFNSAAALRHAKDAKVRVDWVRPGIALYGSSPDEPSHSAAHWGLKPVMSLNAAVIGVQHLQVGDTVGYGSAFVADRPMRIGVVACGYADGYTRHAPTGTPVCIDGIRSKTLGRVSMDMLTVDLTDLPQASIGSPVECWGKQIDVNLVAQQAGTISYELLCNVKRVPRVYTN
jgi:alanine racemase